MTVFKDFSKIMKQAKKMQEDMEKMQKDMGAKEFEGISGAGLVTCCVSGKSHIKSLVIDASLIKEDEKDILEDLVIAALNDALDKVKKETESQMGTLTGGLDLKLPF